MERHILLSMSLYLFHDDSGIMGKMNIVLSDETEEKLRRTVFEYVGMKKGNISLAIEEAIQEWVKRKEAEKKKTR